MWKKLFNSWSVNTSDHQLMNARNGTTASYVPSDSGNSFVVIQESGVVPRTVLLLYIQYLERNLGGKRYWNKFLTTVKQSSKFTRVFHNKNSTTRDYRDVYIHLMYSEGYTMSKLFKQEAFDKLIQPIFGMRRVDAIFLMADICYKTDCIE